MDEWDRIEQDEHERLEKVVAEREQLLRFTSPGFQVTVRQERKNEKRREAKQLEKVCRKQKAGNILGGILMFFLLIVGMAVVVGVLYAATRFVKWAWHH